MATGIVEKETLPLRWQGGGWLRKQDALVLWDDDEHRNVHPQARKHLSPLTSHLPPLTSHLSPPTSHLSPLTSHLSPLTSHLPPLTSHLSPLTSHLSPLTSHLSPPTSHLPPPTSHLSPLTSHLPPPTSHLSPLTSHLSPPTSHLSPPTSHLPPSSSGHQLYEIPALMMRGLTVKSAVLVPVLSKMPFVEVSSGTYLPSILIDQGPLIFTSAPRLRSSPTLF